MLLDDNGKELKIEKKKEDVIARLQEFAPQNKEEERILATKIGESIEFHRQKRMTKGLNGGFDPLFEANAKERMNGDNWSDGRDYRHIASIPREMVYVAEQLYGSDVLTNKEKFKEAFVKDEAGQFCLTVDPKTI